MTPSKFIYKLFYETNSTITIYIPNEKNGDVLRTSNDVGINVVDNDIVIRISDNANEDDADVWVNISIAKHEIAQLIGGAKYTVPSEPSENEIPIILLRGNIMRKIFIHTFDCFKMYFPEAFITCHSHQDVFFEESGDGYALMCFVADDPATSKTLSYNKINSYIRNKVFGIQ